MSLCHKLKLSNPYIFATRWCKPLIFQIMIIGSNKIHSLKYLRFTTLRCKDIGIRKSEFVAKTQFLCLWKATRSQSYTSIIVNIWLFSSYLVSRLPLRWKIIEFLCHKLGFRLSIYLPPGNSVNLWYLI